MKDAIKSHLSEIEQLVASSTELNTAQKSDLTTQLRSLGVNVDTAYAQPAPRVREELGAKITERPDLALREQQANQQSDRGHRAPTAEVLRKGVLPPSGERQQPEPPHAAERAQPGLSTR